MTVNATEKFDTQHQQTNTIATEWHCPWHCPFITRLIHQGRENIASRPLKIIAISIIFCGNLH
jgi:hypothetical protein